MWRFLAAAALAALALLTACDRPSDKAKREYQLMLKSGATLEEQCEKLREVAAAYLAEENEKEYEWADIQADSKCLEVSLQRLRNRRY